MRRMQIVAVVVVVRIACSWTVSQGCQRMMSVSQACRCSWTVSQSVVPSCQRMASVSHIAIFRQLVVVTAAAAMVACSATVSQPYSYIGQNCHMVEVVVGAVIPAIRSTVMKNVRSLFGSVQVYPAAEVVGVALRNTQEVENQQARSGVMAVGEWATLEQTARMLQSKLKSSLVEDPSLMGVVIEEARCPLVKLFVIYAANQVT